MSSSNLRKEEGSLRSRMNSAQSLSSPLTLADRIKNLTKPRSASNSKAPAEPAMLPAEELTFMSYDAASSAGLMVDVKKLKSLQKAVFDKDAKKVVKLIAEKNRDINKIDADNSLTALYLAATNGSLEMVKLLLEGTNKADPNIQCGKMRRTALIQAVINDHEPIVSLLVAHNANVNITDKWSCNAITYTLENKDTVALKKLLKGKPALEYNDKSGMGMLHHAARLGKSVQAKMLIQAGCSIEIRDEMDRTPLHHAIKAGSFSSVEILLKLGASVYSQDMNRLTPIDYLAASKFNQEITNAIELAKSNEKKELDETMESSRRYSILSIASANNTMAINGATVKAASSTAAPRAVSVAESIITVSSFASEESTPLSPVQNPVVRLASPLKNQLAQKNSVTSGQSKLVKIIEPIQEESSLPVAQTPDGSRDILNDEQDAQSNNSDKYQELIARYEFEIVKLINQVESEQSATQHSTEESEAAREQLILLQSNLTEIRDLYEESVQQMTELQYERDRLASDNAKLIAHIESVDAENYPDKIAQIQEDLFEKETLIQDLMQRLQAIQAQFAKYQAELPRDSLQVEKEKSERIMILERLVKDKDIDIEKLRLETSSNSGLAAIIKSLQESIAIKDEIINNSDHHSTDHEASSQLRERESDVQNLKRKLLDKEREYQTIKEESDTSYLEESIRKLEVALVEKDELIDSIKVKLDDAQQFEDTAVLLRKSIREKDLLIEDLQIESEKSRQGIRSQDRSMDYLGFMTDIDQKIRNLEIVVEEKDAIIADLQSKTHHQEKEMSSLRASQIELAQSADNAVESDIALITKRLNNLKQKRQPDSGMGVSAHGLQKGPFNNSMILNSIMNNLGSTIKAVSDLSAFRTDIVVRNVAVQDFQCALSEYAELIRSDLSMISNNVVAYTKMHAEHPSPTHGPPALPPLIESSLTDKIRELELTLQQKEQVIFENQAEIARIRKDKAAQELHLQVTKAKADLVESNRSHEASIKDQRQVHDHEISQLKTEHRRQSSANELGTVDEKKQHERALSQSKMLIEKKDAEVTSLKSTIETHHKEIAELELKKTIIERELQGKLAITTSDSHVEKLELKTKISTLERSIQKLQNDKILLEEKLSDALSDIEAKTSEIAKLVARNDTIQMKFEPALNEKERQVNMLKQEIQVIGNDKDNVMRNVKELQEERMQLERKVTDILRQCESLQSSHEMQLLSKDAYAKNLTSNCLALESEKAILYAESSSLSVLVGTLHNDLSALKLQLQDISSSAFSKDGQIAELHHQLSSLKVFKQQVEELQGELTVATLSKKQLLELEQSHSKVKNQLQESLDKYSGVLIGYEGLQTQHQKLSESVIMKTQRIRDLEEELTSSREQVILTAQLEEMLKHQHHEISQQLQKHGITLSTQQSTSLEVYIKVQQEAIGSLEEMLTNMQSHHNTQIEHNNTLQASAHQKQQQSEIRIHGYEQEVNHLRNLVTEYKHKVMCIENKLEEAHRVHIDLKDDQSSILLQAQTQQQMMGQKYAALKDEARKLQNKLGVAMKAKTDVEEELQRTYDTHVHKILKRIEGQSMNRATLEEAKKLSQIALVDTYEQHIRTLTIELNGLRTNALRTTAQKTGRRY